MNNLYKSTPLNFTNRSAFNLEGRLDPDGHTLVVLKTGVVVASGVPPWTQRGTLKGGRESDSTSAGRIISVKCGELTKRIGINGSSKAIKEVIRAPFGLRTKRAFWSEDKDAIVRTLDRDMLLGNYILHLDEGNMTN
ncbi:hypothetical protein F0562_023313 [Nyssa sinensis]|uniref:GT-1/4-like C-terminal domain-containing protein n=1 Tax=Nyssa sinensis TaxID=561372 RepID=A0A5J5BM41_9ASTE|nr:hypothetical protein F0562_023313 [Nyssa sinensis]